LAAEKQESGVVRDEIVLGRMMCFYDVRQWSDMGRCHSLEDGFSVFFVKKEREARVWVRRRINCLIQSDSF
jgi:hypothetical protein